MRKRLSILALSLTLLAAALVQTTAQPAATGNKSLSKLDSDPHLVGWWKLEEKAGKNAADSSPQSHAGTLQGGLSFDQNSVSDQNHRALRLAAGEHYIQITGFKGVVGTKPRTIVVWMKTAVPEGEIVSWGHRDFGKMWTLGFIRGHVGVTPNGGYLYMKTGLQDDVWHHVAAVVYPADPPNLHDNVKLYLDGSLAVIDDIGLLDLWPVDTTADMDVQIGRRFKGLLRDVRIYDRALAEDEVKALFMQKSY